MLVTASCCQCQEPAWAFKGHERNALCSMRCLTRWDARHALMEYEIKVAELVYEDEDFLEVVAKRKYDSLYNEVRRAYMITEWI